MPGDHPRVKREERRGEKTLAGYRVDGPPLYSHPFIEVEISDILLTPYSDWSAPPLVAPLLLLAIQMSLSDQRVVPLRNYPDGFRTGWEARETFETALTPSSSPEEIDEGAAAAPSKRILQVVRAYQKPLDGPFLTLDIGLDAIRARCPHFDRWVRLLEGLG